MLGALVIVFREVLEAGLIIGIVLAATQRLAMSKRYIFTGVLAGIIGSCLVALFMSAIADSFDGFGQEIFNAAILITAVLMLIWHGIWMSRHGRELVHSLKETGREISEGKKSLMALAIVVGVAVLREGAEVVLFLYGIAMNSSAASMISGGLLGLLLGALVSGLTFLGLLQIPSRYIFTVTSWLIAFIAAGLAAQATLLLQNAGVITVLDQSLWNSSWLLSERSIIGMLLHTLIGYSENPTALQVIVYVSVLVLIYILSRIFRPSPAPRIKEQAKATS